MGAVSKWIVKRDKRTRGGVKTGQIWRAGYRDETGREYTKHFSRRVDAAEWLDTATADLVRGEHLGDC